MMPDQTHAVPLGHGETRSSAVKLWASAKVIRRGYARTPHDADSHVPRRLAGASAGPTVGAVVGKGSAVVGALGIAGAAVVVAAGGAVVAAGVVDVVAGGIGLVTASVGAFDVAAD